MPISPNRPVLSAQGLGALACKKLIVVCTMEHYDKHNIKLCYFGIEHFFPRVPF